MAVNEEHRQVEIAAELAERARTLAHSTRTVPSPPDSYRLLGELRSTIDDLEQVCRQLGSWHHKATEGVEYQGGDGRAEASNSTWKASTGLGLAADRLSAASDAVAKAHSANGIVRWRKGPAEGWLTEGEAG